MRSAGSSGNCVASRSAILSSASRSARCLWACRACSVEVLVLIHARLSPYGAIVRRQNECLQALDGSNEPGSAGATLLVINDAGSPGGAAHTPDGVAPADLRSVCRGLRGTTADGDKYSEAATNRTTPAGFGERPTPWPRRHARQNRCPHSS